MIRGKLEIKIVSNFMGRETQDYAPLQQQATNNNSHNFKTYSNKFNHSDFPCHLKGN